MSTLTDVPRSSLNILTLSKCEVYAEDGNRLLLGRLWKNRPIIFVFLRHFACIACRAHAVEVWNDRERLQKTDARIVFIGNGQPHMIEVFKEELGIQSAIVYTDPSLKSFEAAGFKRGFFRAHSLTSVANMTTLALQGHKQSLPSKAKGNISQLGGVLVVGTNGAPRYHKISEAIGDFPSEEDMQNIPWLSDETKKDLIESNS